jgi:hypothetical protein
LTIYRRSVPLVMAIIVVNVMSLLDGISTFLLVDNDSCIEYNPLMSALLEHNYLQFFCFKLGITLLGTLICWHFYERQGSARWALKFISRTYCTLMLWQTLLLTGLIK